MPALLNTVDPDGLAEFSVVFTDRSLNHMSAAFQEVMRDIASAMREVYNADAVALVPGGGTYGMEAVARAFASDGGMVVVRNGWFSYRWSQIVEACALPVKETVMKARRQGNAPDSPFAPAPIEDVVAAIRAERPAVVVAPHVETSAGIILPDAYIAALSEAAHEVGALMVLDCIASGCVWVDMKATGVDVLISAPQKGWSSTPCAGLVMMSAEARARLAEQRPASFAVDLKKWAEIMDAYENGGHAYHATMPTDGLRAFRDTVAESRRIGFGILSDAQWALGQGVRDYLASKGVKSVAAPGFESPGVVVSYTSDPAMQSGAAFSAHGMQIAAGVPLMVDEGPEFRTFRIGLFGLDKLRDVDATLERFRAVADEVL